MTYNPVGEPGQAHPSDTFSVVMKSVWGDTWEWPAVTITEAMAVNEACGKHAIFTNAADRGADSEP